MSRSTCVAAFVAVVAPTYVLALGLGLLDVSSVFPSMAIIIALLLASVRTTHQLQRMNRSSLHLLNFMHVATGSDDPHHTASAAVQTASAIFPGAAVALSMGPASDDEWIGAGRPDTSALDELLAETITLVDDVIVLNSPDQPQTALGNIGHGWLSVTPARGRLSTHDMATLASLASQVRVALDSARRGRSLRDQAASATHQARHDELTGLPNRYAMKQEMSAAVADDRPFGVLLLDLNNFKQVNDTLGHDAGDGVLRSVAACVRPLGAEIRMFARLGGDEFAAIVDGDLADAQRMATVIQQAIAVELTAPHLRVAVTASIGISTFPGDGGDPSTLLKRADEAMYTAKRAGGGIAISGPDDLHIVNSGRQLVL